MSAVALGMPSRERVARHAKREGNEALGAPWLRRYASATEDFVEVVYLRVLNGAIYSRAPTSGVWYLAGSWLRDSQWWPLDSVGDRVMVPE